MKKSRKTALSTVVSLEKGRRKRKCQLKNTLPRKKVGVFYRLLDKSCREANSLASFQEMFDSFSSISLTSAF